MSVLPIPLMSKSNYGTYPPYKYLAEAICVRRNALKLILVLKVFPIFYMSCHECSAFKKPWCEEDRRKKECEPYEEIIRKLRKRDRERAKLEQSPTDRKS